MVKFIVLSLPLAPSPLNSSVLVLVSVTCTFSINSAGKFCVATLPSLPKKGLPFTKILFTSLPFTFIFPSESISTPGNSFNKASTLASGRTLKDEALNSNVSFLITIGGISPFKSMVFNISTSSSNCKIPKSKLAESPSIFLLNGKKPVYDTRKIKGSFTAFLSTIKAPLASVIL